MAVAAWAMSGCSQRGTARRWVSLATVRYVPNGRFRRGAMVVAALRAAAGESTPEMPNHADAKVPCGAGRGTGSEIGRAHV